MADKTSISWTDSSWNPWIGGEYAPKADLSEAVYDEFNVPATQRGPSPVWMQRIGKKAAGRALDGREHSEFPS